MVLGYSTHGYWASLKELKEIEVDDRGNSWFDDTQINLDTMEGIWVTLDPKKAVRYLFLGEEIESEDYQEALKNPKDHLFQVDLTGATPVLEDGDDGILYIKRRVKGNTIMSGQHQSGS